MSSKEAELLKDGYNAEKSCNSPKQSPLTMDLAGSMDPSAGEADLSAGEADPPSSSNAPSSYGLHSQSKLESGTVPRTSKNYLFKTGMPF